MKSKGVHHYRVSGGIENALYGAAEGPCHTGCGIGGLSRCFLLRLSQLLLLFRGETGGGLFAVGRN